MRNNILDTAKTFKDSTQLKNYIRRVWRDGFDPIKESKVEFSEVKDFIETTFRVKDAIALPNAIATVPNVITEVAREAAEPLLVLSGLLDRVQHRPGLQIIHGGGGAVTAADLAEGQAYPEVQVQMGGASAVANIGKSGIAFKLTDEMTRYSQFDVINVHIKACGRALARHKEEKIADALVGMGVWVFDNANPTNSILGVTHGRDENGVANGTLTWDDLFDMFGVVIANGFMPNLMIVHPLTWIMFMKDPVLRSFALAAGGGTWWGSYSGNPAGRAPWSTGRINGPGHGMNSNPPGGNPTPTPLAQMPAVPTMESSPNIPSYFLPYPVSIITSYQVYYGGGNKRLTDIIICDSMELGALVVDEELSMEEWRDPSVDMMKMKFRERYGIVIYHQGQAVAVARNIRVDSNQVVLPARASFDISSLTAIPQNTAVV